MEPPDPQKPLLVSMGDPAGIGPDLIVEVQHRQQQRRLTGMPAWVVAGDPDVIAARAAQLGKPVAITSGASLPASLLPDRLFVLTTSAGAAAGCEPGKPSPHYASAITGAIEAAVAGVRRGEAAGVVTLPIAKHVLHQSGFKHPGHTEYLGKLASQQWPAEAAVEPVMMLASEELRVVPVTIHVPIAKVAGLLTKERVLATALTTLKALARDFGIGRPRLMVAGLNPHAGESGSIGNEDKDVLVPAVAELKGMGYDVTGPASADTLFHEAARQRYDACLCMYHDQALIPLKTLAFDRGVNVTLGLPFVRTSPDHGTAFDIAGTGRAQPASFIEALRLAASIARRRAAAAAATGAAAAR